MSADDPNVADTLADGATLGAEDGPATSSAGALVTVERSHYAMGFAIAEGGMGVVRAADDLRTGRRVAVKELLGDPSTLARQRFEREARITAQLQHPNIVPVYEVGQWPDGRPFFAMKLVGGRPLDEVADAALDADARLALVPRILPAVDAIAYAHENGIIHRDLKPANVLLGEFGETIVIDWGLAKAIGDADDTLDGRTPSVRPPAAESQDKLTVDGMILGTPAYMPPEQARSESLDARADVYSLGALLYHALSGHAPYEGTIPEVLRALLAGPPESLAARAPGTPPDLVSIVEKAMAPDRADRYADARELAHDLDAFLTGRLVQAYEYTSWELLTRFVRRNRALTASFALLVVIATVAGIFVVREQRVTERERERAVVAEGRARAQERVAHERLAQAHWQSAVRRLQDGDHLGAELFAAAAMVESPEPLPGAIGTWSAARALRFATLTASYDEHTDWLYDVIVSSDDRWLVTTSADRRALIWDRATRRVHRALEGHRDTVFQASLDAAGLRLATSSYDGTIRVWSFPDGELLRIIEHPADRVYGVCFAADGSLLGAGGDGTVVVFDAATGERRRTIDVTSSIPWRLRCPRDVPIATMGTTGATVVVVDLESGVARGLVDTGVWSTDKQARVRAVLFTRDSRELVTADEEGVLRRFDRVSGTLLARTQLGEHYGAIAVSPDGRWLVLGADEVTVVDAETLRPIARLRAHSAEVAALAFDSTGERLFTGSDDNRVIEWELPRTPNALAITAPSQSRVDAIAQSADERWLVAAGDESTARVWDTVTGRLHGDLEGHSAPVRAATFIGPTQLVTTGMDRTAWLHDVETGSSERLLELSHFGDELALAPDGETLVIAVGDGSIVFRDRGSGSLQSVDVHEARAWWVGFDSSGAHLASADFAGEVALIDPDERSVIRKWDAHDARIYDASWRPDGSELTTVDLDGWLRGWDPHSGEKTREWRVLDGEPIRSVAWSPNGERVLVTTDGGARVYAPDGALQARIELRDRATAAGWTTDGRMRFASAGHVYVMPLDLSASERAPAELLVEAERAGGRTLRDLME